MPISSVLGSSALLPAGLGFRNVLINGDFRINQRAFTSTTTSDAYGFDRWTILTGGGLTYSAQTFTAGNAIPGQEPINFARLATSGQSASSAYSIFTQKIEGVRTCAGQPVTISFWAKAASGTPKVAIELAQVFGTSGSASVDTYINQVTLSTSWVRYVVNTIVPSISGKTVGTANDYFGLTLWTSAGSNFNARTGSLGIQNSTIDFWGVQLEQNLQPTPFEQRPIGTELALCQRYYFAHTNDGATYIDLSARFASDIYRIAVFYTPVPMRKKLASGDITLTISGGSPFYDTFTNRSFRVGVNAGNTTSEIWSTGWSVNAEL